MNRNEYIFLEMKLLALVVGVCVQECALDHVLTLVMVVQARVLGLAQAVLDIVHHLVVHPVQLLVLVVALQSVKVDAVHLVQIHVLLHVVVGVVQDVLDVLDLVKEDVKDLVLVDAIHHVLEIVKELVLEVATKDAQLIVQPDVLVDVNQTVLDIVKVDVEEAVQRVHLEVVLGIMLGITLMGGVVELEEVDK